MPQSAPVCSIYAQSQIMPRIHGAKFGSRFFGSSEPFPGVTWGHEKSPSTSACMLDLDCGLQDIIVADDRIQKICPIDAIPTSAPGARTPDKWGLIDSLKDSVLQFYTTGSFANDRGAERWNSRPLSSSNGAVNEFSSSTESIDHSARLQPQGLCPVHQNDR